MRQLITTLFAILFYLPFTSNGQTKLLSKKVFDTVLFNEKHHPLEFYNSAMSFYNKGDKYDAAFLFYIGQLRYKYYNYANPEVKGDGDKALLASLNSIVGEEINFFLGGHIDNYLVVLDSVIAWDKRHDFEFYSKKKSPEKHKEIIDKLVKYKEYIAANKKEITEKHAEAEKERK